MGNSHSSNKLTTRNTFKLTGDEQEDMISDSKIFNEEIHKMERAMKPKSLTYPSQIIDGQKISQSFFDAKDLCLLQAVGLTQSGKTGVMFSCIQEFVNSKILEPIPTENIYVITGLSSNEWKEQTMERFPSSIRENIFHRNDLKKRLIDSISGKQNVLIIIDEVQIACGANQTISSIMKEANLLNIQYLLANDIKIIEFSATPNGTFYDLDKWGKYSTIMKISQGENYTSCFDLLDSGRVKQSKPLDTSEAINDMVDVIKSYSSFRYHFIRIKKGNEGNETISKIRQEYGDEFEYDNYDMTNSFTIDPVSGEENEGDINSNLLNSPPTKHTLIFIKEKARCAKTFTKKYIGIWYERYAQNFADDVVTQGLLGRATGYDDNGVSIIFTNVESIQKYRELWEGNFDSTIEWTSNSTKKKEGVTQSKNTFNGEVSIDGEVATPESTPVKIVGITKFLGSWDVVKDDLGRFLIDKELAKRCPNKRKTNEDGFYHGTIRRTKGILSTDFVNKNKGCGLNKNFVKRIHPCYTDVNDSTTIEWWVTYHE